MLPLRLPRIPESRRQNSPRYHFETFDQNVPNPARRRGRPARVLDLAAPQQQADAGGMHRIAHHFAQAGDVLRNADAHRHVQHLLGQFHHAFHLRGAAGQHHAGTHQFLEAGAAQFGLHHLEDFLVAVLHRFSQRLARRRRGGRSPTLGTWIDSSAVASCASAQA
jgi:hypothetical protein